MDTNAACPTCGKTVVPGVPQGLCPECLIRSGFETRKVDEPGQGSAAFVPPSVEEVAGLFPQLEILELLGHGGMGAVYKARQPRLNRLVALKILSPEKQNDPQFAERFQREARAMAWLSHPNIVTVYDFGEVQGRFYLLMEFVDGLTLRQLYQTRKLAPAEALAVVPKICEALQYAHDLGVVHRDIKPENILLDKNGQVKIADFGIAKIMELGPGDLALTGAKDVVGTPHYMAPEQVEKPQAVDCRADIYSLGVVFYEMLTGELPLGNFQPPSQKVQVDVRLDDVVLHALEKEPDRRYQMASQVKTDVETIARATAGKAEPKGSPVPPLLSTPVGQAARARPAPPPVSVGLSTGWKIAIALAGLGLLAVALLAGLAVWFVEAKLKAVPAGLAGLVSTNETPPPAQFSPTPPPESSPPAERRRALRGKFDERLALDRKRYTPEQLRDVDRTYQTANKLRGTSAYDSVLTSMAQKYPGANRTGCAMLYLAQATAGQTREGRLEYCIQHLGDCYYGDGVQVGAYARFLLAKDYEKAGQGARAEKLYQELRENYPDAVDHSGRLLSDIMPARLER
jgi:serine/threonine protein kinase